jgi:hypothetical protein
MFALGLLLLTLFLLTASSFAIPALSRQAKERWPHTAFLGTPPGLPPIALRYNHFFHHTPAKANHYNETLLGHGE